MEIGIGLLSFSFSLVIMAAVMQFVRDTTVNGTQGRNPVIGIRTKTTQSSDLAWKAGHQAAAPWLRLTSLVGYSTGGLTIAIAIAHIAMNAHTPATLAIPGVSMIGMMALVVIATREANRAGIEATEDD